MNNRPLNTPHSFQQNSLLRSVDSENSVYEKKAIYKVGDGMFVFSSRFNIGSTPSHFSLPSFTSIKRLLKRSFNKWTRQKPVLRIVD